MLYIALMIAVLFVLIIGLTCCFVGLHYAIEAKIDTRFQLIFISAILVFVVFIIFCSIELGELVGKT